MQSRSRSCPAPTDFAALPDPALALHIVYEDGALVAVDKAPGVPSHPLRPDEVGTVANALVARYPEMAGIGWSPREPGLVHRLDTDTSGLLLAARTPAAFERMRDALRAGRIDKRYLALCAGRVVAPQIIDLPLANHPRDARRVVACITEADIARLRPRPAETEVLRVERVGDLSLVEVRAKSARRHQVRAHLAALGHALAGDTLYGGPDVTGLERHFLHASALEVVHPTTGAPLHLAAELPADLRAVLDAVRGGA